MFHCSRLNKIRNGLLSTYIQFPTLNTSEAPCFNFRFLAIFLNQPDTTLQSLSFSSNLSICFVTPASCTSLLVLLFHPLYLCLRSCFFAFVPLCAFFRFTSSPSDVFNEPAAFACPLPRCTDRQLRDVPCAGNCEGLLLFVIMTGTFKTSWHTSYESSHCFCVSAISYITHWWCFDFHWDLSHSPSLSSLVYSNQAVALAVRILPKGIISISFLTLLSWTLLSKRMKSWTKELWGLVDSGYYQFIKSFFETIWGNW